MRRAAGSILQLFHQGRSPRRIAFTVALGVTFGVMPIVGIPAGLCALAAFAFGLNLGAIQAVNLLAMPLQLALVVPWIRLGEWVFWVDSIDLEDLQVGIQSSSGLDQLVSQVGWSLLRATSVWAATAPANAALVYLAALPLARRSAAEPPRSGEAEPAQARRADKQPEGYERVA